MKASNSQLQPNIIMINKILSRTKMLTVTATKKGPWHLNSAYWRRAILWTFSGTDLVPTVWMSKTLWMINMMRQRKFTGPCFLVKCGGLLDRRPLLHSRCRRWCLCACVHAVPSSPSVQATQTSTSCSWCCLLGLVIVRLMMVTVGPWHSP